MRAVKWIGRAVIVLVVATLVLTAGAYAYDRRQTATVMDEFAPRGEFVDVDGARMHVICRGAGEPTLVLEAGIAGGALDWLPLMDELATDHRVCAFDRLGQDWSDPAPTPRTLGTAADELAVALAELGISQPVIVGHSLGSVIVQIYAARYPVAGVVLADGLTLDAVGPVTRRLGSYQRLDPAARAGLLRPLAGLFVDGAYAPALRREMQALRGQSHVLLGVSAEGALAAQTAATELAAAEPRITAPMLIIAAGANELPEAALFTQAQQALAARHTDTTLVTIPGATHYVIASHAPDVATSIRTWLNTATGAP